MYVESALLPDFLFFPDECVCHPLRCMHRPLGICMGMAYPCGSWVWVPVGVGVGWTLATHANTHTHDVGLVVVPMGMLYTCC